LPRPITEKERSDWLKKKGTGKGYRFSPSTAKVRGRKAVSGGSSFWGSLWPEKNLGQRSAGGGGSKSFLGKGRIGVSGKKKKFQEKTKKKKNGGGGKEMFPC